MLSFLLKVLKGISKSSIKLSATSFKLAPTIKPIATGNTLNFSKTNNNPVASFLTYIIYYYFFWLFGVVAA